VGTNRLACLFLALVLAAAGCKKKPAPTTSPLHWATKTGNIQHIKSLLAAGADVDAKDDEGATTMHYAAASDDITIVELLAAKGADINAEDKDALTPFNVALRLFRSDVAAFLYDNSAHANITDGDKTDLLVGASMFGVAELVDRLVAEGVDVNVTSLGPSYYFSDYPYYHNWTPLLAAIYGGHEAIIKLLIARGADVNARDNTGRTPAQDTARRGHGQIVAILKKHVAEE